MIRRIELLNFMSHSHTVIELADGLTVLIGDNNSGKSAIVAALQAVCQNASGSYMVRHGETFCSVTIETEEEAVERSDDNLAKAGRNVLTWQRNKGKVSYVVNGREVDRLKGGVPSDLHELLRLPPVQTSRDSFEVHFGEQKQPIFLLADKSSDRAAFFASSSDTCKLIEMQELHRTRTSEARRNLKSRISVRQELSSRLSNFAELDEVETQLDSLSELFDTLQELETKRSSIRKCLDSKHSSLSQIHGHRQVASVLGLLKLPPKIRDVSSLQMTMEGLTKSRIQIEDTKNRLAATRELAVPPIVRNPKPLDEMVVRLQEATRNVNMSLRTRSAFSKLDTPPTFNRLDKSRELSSTIKALAQARDKLAKLQTDLDSAGRKLVSVETALRQTFEEFDSCPTCKQKINVEYSLTRTKIADPVAGKSDTVSAQARIAKPSPKHRAKLAKRDTPKSEAN